MMVVEVPMTKYEWEVLALIVIIAVSLILFGYFRYWWKHKKTRRILNDWKWDRRDIQCYA